jgi:zinc transport system substrate-binding protein
VTRSLRAIGLLALAAAFVLNACNQSPPSETGLLVVASFYPLYEFTHQVAGPSARVVSLVPTGAEPHDWEPSPQDLVEIREARLLVHNGGGLDPWVSRLLSEPASPKTLIVRATEGIPLLTSTPSSDGRGPDRPIPDPHVWLDPVLAQSMVETIRAALARVDPDHAATYAENSRRFVAELQALHEKFKAGLDHCARREVVTSHAAWAYLAKRYDLTVLPVMGLTPEAEPSPAQLASIVRFARDRKVKYIFFETLVSPGLAETLAREIGARTLVFNPIEGLTKDEQAAGRGYVALMEENLKNLRIALDCR